MYGWTVLIEMHNDTQGQLLSDDAGVLVLTSSSFVALFIGWHANLASLLHFSASELTSGS